MKKQHSSKSETNNVSGTGTNVITDVFIAYAYCLLNTYLLLF